MSDAASIPAPEDSITTELMVDQARNMIPTLRKRAAEAERLRTLPQETVNDFLQAGFYRILQPRRKPAR
jgi:3-hydroxy-9,10-secoandrosta-1,3,5(10)-triene-9,17-dione monooxygenase